MGPLTYKKSSFQNMPWLSANVDALGLHTTTKNDFKKKLIKLKDISWVYAAEQN